MECVDVAFSLPDEFLAALEARVVSKLERARVEPKPWPEFLSDRSAARYADVSTSTVERWRKAGLRSYIVNGVVRIKRRDLDAWMEQRPTRAR
jgi:excisionase family DNA binding protein